MIRRTRTWHSSGRGELRACLAAELVFPDLDGPRIRLKLTAHSGHLRLCFDGWLLQIGYARWRQPPKWVREAELQLGILLDKARKNPHRVSRWGWNGV